MKRLMSGSTVKMTHDGRAIDLIHEDDYVMGGNAVSEETEVTAPVVFIGFGVTAPEQGYDDYAGIDVKGRIILFMSGAPSYFPHNERAYYSSGSVKYNNAVERGAVGAIRVFSPGDAKRVPWSRVVAQSVFPSMRWLTKDGTPHNSFPQIRGSALFSEPGGDKLFQAIGRSADEVFASIDAGTPQSFAMRLVATIRQKGIHEQISAPNVVAVLPGSDPGLSDEYVLFTAHLDHMGVGNPDKNGDPIYNGAYDNAVGVSMLIEVARAIASLDERPSRSLLFLAVSGEERGLLGSEYYAEQASSPVDRIVGNVNLDMPVLVFSFSDLVAFGAEHSSMAGIVERSAERVGFTLSPDPRPEEVIFIRSDQYSFVKKGIPSVFVVPGQTATDPGIDGPEVWDRFLATVYHTPSDDMSQEFHWETGVRFTQANVAIGMEIANSPVRPTWNEGDFFGDKFASDERRR